MKRYFSSLILALACLAGACSSSETRTQLTFVIDASPAIRDALRQLTVVVRSDARGDDSATFAASELNWPVEIVVVPAGGQESTHEVTLFAKALGAGGTMLLEQNAKARFQPGKLRIVNLTLGTIPPDAGMRADSGTSPGNQDAGDVPAPVPDSGMVDPGEPDTGAPVVNCETQPNTIKCDDGSKCNGTELCMPSSPSANASGCVPGTMPTPCNEDQTCVRETGECSTCLANADGDNDGADAEACPNGDDCDDSDDTVAPGSPELCDLKDNDCDGTPDGARADTYCGTLPSAPEDTSAKCMGRSGCVYTCSDPAYELRNNVCVKRPVICPVANPCLPGTCGPGADAYVCMCPEGYRTGLGSSRCAPIGAAGKIGFESGCAMAPTPGEFVMEHKALPPTLYAACGVASIATGATLSPARLYQPSMPLIAGLTGTVAVASPVGGTGAVVLTISFLPAVSALSFDILDIDSLTGIQAVVRAGGADLAPMVLQPVGTTKRVAFTATAATPTATIESVTLTYTPASATDAFYIDELAYRVAGCGDAVMSAGEACDDGNSVQCDGCDNACAVSPTSCSVAP